MESMTAAHQPSDRELAAQQLAHAASLVREVTAQSVTARRFAVTAAAAHKAGFTPDQIAAALRCSPATVRRWLA